MGAAGGQVWSMESLLDGFARAEGLLVAARRTLARRGVWARGALTFAADGRRVAAADPDAVRFCAAGALLRAAAEAGVVEPLALMIEEDTPGAKPGPPPSAPVAAAACALCAVAGARLGAPWELRSSTERGGAVANTLATLPDEARSLHEAAAPPRLLTAVATVNDLPPTTLPTLLADLRAATAVARATARHPDEPANARRLHDLLEQVTPAAEPAP